MKTNFNLFANLWFVIIFLAFCVYFTIDTYVTQHKIDFGGVFWIIILSFIIILNIHKRDKT